jgi:hypothetical protein
VGEPSPRAVFFISDSTGITAETLGSALLSNFPALEFERRTLPFVDNPDRAREIVRDIHEAAARGATPLVFTTVKATAVQQALREARAVTIDLLHGHLAELERVLSTKASVQPGQFHGLGDTGEYRARMRAVEFAIEHDDGKSLRALDSAEVVIIGPSRCGKTPTTMYLALQYGVLAANYPLTDDDFPADELPRPLANSARRCFGLITTPQRLSQVRQERRPDSQYASLAQCALELRRAEDLYRRHRIPYLNSSTKSVEEMSAVILHTMKLRA